ncbi:DsbA family oxidoreductase [Kurthia gibsonii]|uniref:DsbA family oxidoreductase n=1 Tax=Kurthia gibsonii TaxID=33946 RepID=A0ABU9LNL5_9BACL|nr:MULTISPECIES: DsbA family oxidoreductase [Kurthia]AMA63310.1 DSBA-like thioredoxin domain protein [Kurthia sp. 11kri321]MEB6112162.1 DsbA family oxidoreductase [Kurthia gibsonii]MEB7771155.1 DsbA family oxidoreductase [Kurthia gibsonii]RXH51079.1 DsbA family oxidoreductase [Kurthia gibsonii]HZG12493.1 DsbA family oxidoreductase [Kurthia gibsonii]
MKIEVFTDYTCPFCYIGKQKLMQAIEKTNLQEPIEIQYKNYEVHPEIQGAVQQPYKDYLLESMDGRAEKVDTFLAELQQHANEVGLTYHFDTMIPANTADAHRLAKWMAKEQKEHEWTERLMQGHFVEGKDLSDRAYLFSVIEELGYSKKEAKRILDGQDYQQELDQDAYDAQQIGVDRAPFFVFDNRFGIIGAEPEEVFIRTLKQTAGEN